MTIENDTIGGPPLASTARASEDELAFDHWSGTTLGKYRIVRRIGRGGMGVVYQAVDPILQRAVAIKILREGIAAQPDSVRKFLREARTAAKLNNPHVVAVYDADQEKGIVYLVMEIMEAGSAHDRIRTWGPFGWVEATKVMLEACRGLTAVHAAGLIHRDIKPSNIMRAHDGLVKLTDFGLALTANPSDSNLPKGQAIGTPLYMSPEQCQAKKLDQRSDIYAMGATYYTLLTGNAPFEGKSPLEILYGHVNRPVPNVCDMNREIPAACADLIRRSMAKEPDKRPQDAAALLAELEGILTLDTSPKSKPLDWPEQLQNTPVGVSTAVEPITPVYLTTRRPRTRAWFIGVCLILMGVAFAVGRHFSRPALPPSGKPAPFVEKIGPAEELPSALTVFHVGGPATALAFDPLEGTRLFCGTGNGEQKIYFWPDRSERRTLSRAATGGPEIRQILLRSRNGREFWLTLANGKLNQFDAQTFLNKSADEIQAWPGHEITSVSVASVDLRFQRQNPAGESRTEKQQLLAFAVKNGDSPPKGGIVLHWLKADGSENVFRQTVDQQPPTCLAFSRDGSLLMTGKDNGIAQIWKTGIRTKSFSEKGKMECFAESYGSISVGTGRITDVAGVSENRFAVAIGSRVWLCDAEKGSKIDAANRPDMLAPLHDGAQPVTALAVSPSGNRAASAAGKSISIYDLLTGEKLDESLDHEVEVNALAFDQTGERLASGDRDGKIVVRPVQRGASNIILPPAP